MHVEMQPRREAPEQAVDAAEVVKLIRKLRWIGLDDEAHRVQAKLGSAPAMDCVLAEPGDTD